MMGFDPIEISREDIEIALRGPRARSAGSEVPPRQDFEPWSRRSPIAFEVWGVTPAPQGSKTAIVRNGRAVVIDGKGSAGRKAHKEFRAAVAAAGRGWLEANGSPPPLDEPLRVTLLFLFPPIKSDRWRTRHSRQPDLDKLVRSVFDGIEEAGVIANDGRITSLTASKQYAVEERLRGVLIEIEPLGQAEARDRARRKEAR